MTPILKITNGYEFIDLINTQGQGFYLSKWRPLTADYKGGGVYQDNQMSDNRGLINARYDNVSESFEIVLKGDSQDELGKLLHRLMKLGVMATQNWIAPYMNLETRTNGLYTVGKPVWIEARANRESMTRYAVVTKARIPELENPYSNLFSNKDCTATMNEITLELERMHWQTVQPGEAELQEIANYTLDINSIYTDKVPTRGRINLLNEILYSSDHYSTYVGNKDTLSNITYCYYFTDGAFDSNLQNDILPRSLGIKALGDAIYFGNPDLPTTPFTGGPFSSIVMYLDFPGLNYNGIWQYWDGFAWDTLDVQDDSLVAGTTFGRSGHTSIHWRQPIDWTPTIINGVDAWWVRFMIQAVFPGLVTPIITQHRMYAVTWAFIEIDSNEINGEMQALAQIELEDVSDVEGKSSTLPALFADRYIVGARSVNRDIDNAEQFRSRLNTGSDNPNRTLTGLGITETLGADTTYVENAFSQVGSCANWNMIFYSPFVPRYTWYIPYPSGINWFGTFRIFARIMQNLPTDVFDTVQWKIKAYIGNDFLVFESDAKSITENFAFFLIDFGTITIAGDMIQTFENPYVNDLNIVNGIGQGATVKFEILSNHMIDPLGIETEEVDFDILDIVLIPADEMIVESINNSFNEEQSLGYRGTDRPVSLFIDSANYWKNTCRSLLYRKIDTAITATDVQEIFSVWQTKGSQPVTLQTGTKQRLWFLTARKYDPLVSIDDWRSNHEQVCTVRLRKVERYLTFAGDGSS